MLVSYNHTFYNLYLTLQLLERLKERKLVGTYFVDCFKVIMKIKVVLTQSSTVAALPVSFQEETSINMKDESIIILCLFRYLLLDVNSYLTTLHRKLSFC